MNLVNVQGLTKPKLIELEQLLRTDCDLMCLTETQQKYEKLELSSGIEKVDSMREEKDKKGGGLLLMYKSGSLYEVSKVQTSNNDILHAVVKVGGEILHVVLLYFSVISKQEDKAEMPKSRKK